MRSEDSPRVSPYRVVDSRDSRSPKTRVVRDVKNKTSNRSHWCSIWRSVCVTRFFVEGLFYVFYSIEVVVILTKLHRSTNFYGKLVKIERLCFFQSLFFVTPHLVVCVYGVSAVVKRIPHSIHRIKMLSPVRFWTHAEFVANSLVGVHVDAVVQRIPRVFRRQRTRHFRKNSSDLVVGVKPKDRSCHRIFVSEMLFGHAATCCCAPYRKVQLVLPKLHLTRKPVVVHFFFGDFWELVPVPNIRKPYVKTSVCSDLNVLLYKTKIVNWFIYSSWSSHVAFIFRK